MATLSNPPCPVCGKRLRPTTDRFWCETCSREHRLPAMEKACRIGYEHGRKAAKAEIRQVLGISGG